MKIDDSVKIGVMGLKHLRSKLRSMQLCCIQNLLRKQFLFSRASDMGRK